jgi:integrase
MQDVRGVRQVKPGRWEATISHRLLPGGRVFRTFDDEQQAKAYKLLMSRQLAKGLVPPELLSTGRRTNPLVPVSAATPKVVQAPPAVVHTTAATVDLVSVIDRYMAADGIHIAGSDRQTLATLRKVVRGSVEGVSSIWVDAWVRSMKRNQRLAPGTIRKRVESLARCLDWWNRATQPLAVVAINPLRMLPRGYSGYQPQDVAEGQELPRDQERNRRLEAGEYEAIEEVLQGLRCPSKERAWASGGDAEILMLFRLLVHTGLRLREAATLRVDNVRFDLRTIHVRRSKTGVKRDVPMSRQLEGWLRQHMGQKAQDAPVFGFWGGGEDEVALKLLTGRLSARFASLFAYARCPNLVTHDLRHEATCRWMELRDAKGNWTFRPEEVRKITGHKSEAMFMRYLSLRGSDLAARLD